MSDERRDEPKAPDTDPADRAYDEFGVRVAGVLNAAEQVAAQIKAEARRVAAEERERIGEDARVDAGNVRRDAEEEAARIIATAEAAANVIRARAREEAAQVEDAARRRRDELHIDARLLEQRVERALDSLRHISSELASVARHARVPLAPSDEPELEESRMAAPAPNPRAGS